jgi:hypothetical protein
VRRALEAHVGSREVSRVIYGAIVGLALVVALEDHPPSAAVMVGTLLATAVAVALAELYSDVIGIELRTRRLATRERVRPAVHDAAAVAFGLGSPSAFFLLAAAGVIEPDTAFTVAKWSGLGLITFYGVCAGRLAGAGVLRALVHGLSVGLVGGVLIAFKAVLH